MNLVKILSHGSDEESNLAVKNVDQSKIEEDRASSIENGQVQGMALTVKEECIDLIIDICTNIRPESFLQFCEHDSPMYCASADELIIIPDENQLIIAIDQKQITSWSEFEYILSIIIENRLLRLYQAHLDRQYQLQWEQNGGVDTIISDEETPKTPEKANKKKKRKPKKKNKKSKTDCTAASSKDVESKGSDQEA